MRSIFSKKWGATILPEGGDALHTCRDLDLLPAARPGFDTAEARTEYTEIPGSSGSLDRTELLTGFVVYDDREGSMTYHLRGRDRLRNAVHTRVKQLLHGRLARIVLDEDPAYYYRGRLEVPDLKPDAASGILTVAGVFEPYKYERTTTAEKWLWDSFSFVNGVVRTVYSGIGTRTVDVRGTNEVLDKDDQPVYLLTDVPYNMGGGEAITLNNETKTVTLYSSPMGGTMTATYTGAISVTALGVTMALSASSKTRAELYDIELPHDVEAVPVTLTGTGSILLEYRAGYL